MAGGVVLMAAMDLRLLKDMRQRHAEDDTVKVPSLWGRMLMIVGAGNDVKEVRKRFLMRVEDGIVSVARYMFEMRAVFRRLEMVLAAEALPGSGLYLRKLNEEPEPVSCDVGVGEVRFPAGPEEPYTVMLQVPYNAYRELASMNDDLEESVFNEINDGVENPDERRTIHSQLLRCRPGRNLKHKKWQYRKVAPSLPSALSLGLDAVLLV
ncbi:hypothetical protein LX32DRAFT_657610 [Colletotrichum zoysiae]|uniref:Uncharacterized protein n=1 Tax=Colletotrichum zoysiae TaxID=1216348 RepID=A0AAD9H505_9PEZI|nr:hypothetical protein LX32DRAFT_657610 [Colletotrichum zoysiae]